MNNLLSYSLTHSLIQTACMPITQVQNHNSTPGFHPTLTMLHFYLTCIQHHADHTIATTFNNQTHPPFNHLCFNPTQLTHIIPCLFSISPTSSIHVAHQVYLYWRKKEHNHIDENKINITWKNIHIKSIQYNKTIHNIVCYYYLYYY